MFSIAAPYVPNRSDYKIVRGVLGIGYFIDGPYAWAQTMVALSWEDAEAVIESLVRQEREREENAYRSGIMH